MGFTRRHRRRRALGFAIACLVVLGAAATALAATGTLTQPSGTGGCVSETGAGNCADGHALAGAHGVAVSPDGKSVYVASFSSSSVAILDRNTTTGALTQPGGSGGCISQTGAGPCADGHALVGVQSVAVSPDGKNVYATTWSDAVVRLDRNTTTGALTQPGGSAGCVSETGAGPCADGHGLKNPVSVTVSPDGASVYVSSPGGDDIARLTRNTTTGALTQPSGTAGCISETGAGPCADGHALSSPVELAVSPDGKNAYVASANSQAVVRLNRNTTTGAVSQPSGTAGCMSLDGTGGECAMAPFVTQGVPGAQFDTTNPGFVGPNGVAVSPDGTSVYLASWGVAHLDRDTTTGALTQRANKAGCMLDGADNPQQPISCANAHGMVAPKSLVVSPDGKNVYVGAPGSDAVARLYRNTTTGVLTQPTGTGGCVSQGGFDKCANGHALNRPASVAVSADGKNVYMATFASDAVARFNREP